MRGGDERDQQKIHLEGAAAVVLQQFRAANDVYEWHESGVAHLLIGDPAEAVTAFTNGVESKSAPATIWNDLAAALIERGLRDKDPEDFARALGAADRALRIDPLLTEACFNRAASLELLHLNAAAADAYRQYLERDSASGWAIEARSRSLRLGIPTRAEEWKRELPTLAHAAASGDEYTVRRLVKEFPQSSRAWAETEFLNDWAEQFRNGDSEASARLVLARSIGNALASLSGERLLRDAVTAIDLAIKQGDAAGLAKAHRAYREGRLLYSQRRVSESSPLFDEAEGEFRREGSPMALLAEYYRANVLVDENRADEALPLIRSALDEAPSAHHALRAQLLWTEGTILLSQGQPRSALDSYQDAIRLFEGLGERENSSSVRDNTAVALSLLGRSRDAWRLRVAGFEEASASGDPSRIQVALESASRHALRTQQWDTSAALFRVALTTGQQTPRQRASALIWRSVALWRAGQSANSDFENARAAVRAIPDAGLREVMDADLQFAEAMTLAETEPRIAIDRLLSVVSFANRRHHPTLLPSALLQRARAYRRLGDLDQAAFDLEQAADRIERGRTDVQEPDLRDSLLGTASRVYQELLDVQLARGDVAAAFDAVERMHSRRILEEITARGAVDVASLVSPLQAKSATANGTVMASYSANADRLTLLTVARSGIHTFTISLPAREIGRMRNDFARSIDRERAEEVRETSTKLYEALLAPMEDDLSSATTLVVVPDENTSGIPFSALAAGPREPFLIERFPIVIAPSVSAYVKGKAALGPSTLAHPLVVGAPAIDSARYPGLAPLTGALPEARAVAALYGTKPLLGSEASVTRVSRELASCDLLHIATHAISERAEAPLSSLVLAPEGSAPGALHVHDVAAIKLGRHPIVVLAGCGTGRVTRADDGIQSLALAFLAAGSRSVVGTLWNLDDGQAPQISLPLHRALRSGVPAAWALRDAQIAAIRRGGPELRDVKTWSAFQVYGTGM